MEKCARYAGHRLAACQASVQRCVGDKAIPIAIAFCYQGVCGVVIRIYICLDVCDCEVRYVRRRCEDRRCTQLTRGVVACSHVAGSCPDFAYGRQHSNCIVSWRQRFHLKIHRPGCYAWTLLPIGGGCRLNCAFRATRHAGQLAELQLQHTTALQAVPQLPSFGIAQSWLRGASSPSRCIPGPGSFGRGASMSLYGLV